MEPWIAISIAAAAFQTLRFMLQKMLSMGPLSAAGATYARFAYAVPFTVAMAFGYLSWTGHPVPSLSGWFWAYALTGGLAQILATLCVVLIFGTRNFAVGITFKKTEVIQTAIVGLIVLGDRVSLPGMVAIIIGLLGVLVLSESPDGGGKGLARFANRAAGLGLLSGFFFAISAVAYRGATLEIASNDAFLRATVAVCVVSIAQTLAMSLWLRFREPGQLTRVWASRRKSVWMGASSMAGSISWFTAFTMQNAAYVFAVGQIEVIFSLLVATLFFHEKISGRELLGIALLSASILVLVLLG